MKKLIALLAIAGLLTPGIALAETVNIYDGPSDDIKMIFVMEDDGYQWSAFSHKVRGGYVIIDQNGNSTMVNDYSQPKQNGLFELPDLLD